MKNNRLLSTTQLIVLRIIFNNESVYAHGLYNKIAEIDNIISESALNRCLSNLEDGGYLYSWEFKSVKSRSVPQKRYSLTNWGHKQYEKMCEVIDKLENLKI